MKMVSNDGQKSATQKSLVQHLRILRIKVCTDNLSKITQTINRGSFMILGNTECSQTLAKQTNAKLNMLQ